MGSEMCIRDSPDPVHNIGPARRLRRTGKVRVSPPDATPTVGLPSVVEDRPEKGWFSATLNFVEI